MKNLITILPIIIAFSCYGQVTKYDHSFIRFHIYGEGEPVFVLSGGPGNDCHQLEDVAIKIGEKHQAILLEQRGSGLSIPANFNKHTINLDAFIKDILFVMDSLKISKAKFFGHSWGAIYASAFAVQYPDKVTSLVFTGPGYMKMNNRFLDKMFNNRMAKLNKEQRQRFDELRKIQVDKWTPEEQKDAADLRATFNTYDTTNMEWKFAKMQRGITNQKANELLLEDLWRINFNLTEELKALHMPISIITCKEDPLAFLTTEFQKYAPQSSVQWLDKCGHFPMYEQPEQFYPLLMDALTR